MVHGHFFKVHGKKTLLDISYYYGIWESVYMERSSDSLFSPVGCFRYGCKLLVLVQNGCIVFEKEYWYIKLGDRASTHDRFWEMEVEQSFRVI